VTDSVCLLGECPDVVERGGEIGIVEICENPQISTGVLFCGKFFSARPNSAFLRRHLFGYFCVRVASHPQIEDIIVFALLLVIAYCLCRRQRKRFRHRQLPHARAGETEVFKNEKLNGAVAPRARLTPGRKLPGVFGGFKVTRFDPLKMPPNF
jgi:hypothetical protein